MCDSELMWPASLKYSLVHHSRKKILALESTVSVLEGSSSAAVYLRHSSALSEVEMKVWGSQRSRCWCQRRVLRHPARAELLTVWLCGFLGPFQWVCEAKITL